MVVVVTTALIRMVVLAIIFIKASKYLQNNSTFQFM
jgi:hypothetical protein